MPKPDVVLTVKYRVYDPDHDLEIEARRQAAFRLLAELVLEEYGQHSEGPERVLMMEQPDAR